MTVHKLDHNSWKPQTVGVMYIVVFGKRYIACTSSFTTSSSTNSKKYLAVWNRGDLYTNLSFQCHSADNTPFHSRKKQTLVNRLMVNIWYWKTIFTNFARYFPLSSSGVFPFKNTPIWECIDAYKDILGKPPTKSTKTAMIEQYEPVNTVNTKKFTTVPVCPYLSYVAAGPSFIKPDQLNPRIKDQLRNALLSTILSLQLPNFVSCGRACPSHMPQNLVTVGAKLWTGEWFSFDSWSLDQADLVW